MPLHIRIDGPDEADVYIRGTVPKYWQLLYPHDPTTRADFTIEQIQGFYLDGVQAKFLNENNEVLYEYPNLPVKLACGAMNEDIRIRDCAEYFTNSIKPWADQSKPESES